MLSVSEQREYLNRWRGQLDFVHKQPSVEENLSSIRECLQIMQNHDIFFSVSSGVSGLNISGNDFNNLAADFGAYNIKSGSEFYADMKEFMKYYHSNDYAYEHTAYMYETEGTCFDGNREINGVSLDVFKDNVKRDCDVSFGSFASCFFELADKFSTDKSADFSDIFKHRFAADDMLSFSQQAEISKVFNQLKDDNVDFLMNYNHQTSDYDVYLHKEGSFDLKVEHVRDARSFVHRFRDALSSHDFAQDLDKKLDFYLTRVVVYEDGKPLMNGKPFEDICGEMALSASQSASNYFPALVNVVNRFCPEYSYDVLHLADSIKHNVSMKVGDNSDVPELVLPDVSKDDSHVMKR